MDQNIKKYLFSHTFYCNFTTMVSAEIKVWFLSSLEHCNQIHRILCQKLLYILRKFTKSSKMRSWGAVPLNNFRFTDDIVPLAESEEDLQSHVTKVDVSSKKFGQTINISKTEVQIISREHIQIDIKDTRQIPCTNWEIYLPRRCCIRKPHQWKRHQTPSSPSYGFLQKLNPVWKHRPGTSSIQPNLNFIGSW